MNPDPYSAQLFYQVRDANPSPPVSSPQNPQDLSDDNASSKEGQKKKAAKKRRQEVLCR
jgi:hypothetical protein